mmetsp:Transcript_7726/g.21132  ORF Transcript_7726/g.21132 Transcript_7726/m.21132 type:complete len:360 (-) Transcript_7726:323-1402(-)
MVDDLRREDAHARILGEGGRVLGHRHVECEDERVLRVRALELGGGPHHVQAVHRADVDGVHGDLGGLEELEQRLERSERGGHGVDAVAVRELVDRLGKLGQVGHNLLLEHLELVLVARPVHEERAASDHLVQVVRGDLDALRATDGGVVHIVCFDADLLEGFGRQQRTHTRHDRSVEAAEHDRVALLKVAVGQDNVHRVAEALDHLHLEHGGLGLAAPHDALHHVLLGEACDELEQIRDALARVSGRGHDGHVLLEVSVVPVHLCVETLLCQGELGLGGAVLELGAHVFALRGKAVAEGAPRLSLPVVEAVHLIERDNEGGLLGAEHVKGLDGLGLEAVHDVDDEDGDVAERRATRAQV